MASDQEHYTYNPDYQAVIRELQAQLETCSVERDALTAEVAALKVYENWDQNYVKCEGCQRHTLPADMREGPDGEGSCCLWCLGLDELEAEVKRLKADLREEEKSHHDTWSEQSRRENSGG